MSTVEERVRSLKAARAWMHKLTAVPAPEPLRYKAAWYLTDYPTDASFDERLCRLEGYVLMMAVRRIERVRALFDEVVSCKTDEPCMAALEKEGLCAARHYPEPQELVPAVRSPRDARVWAAFYLERPPGRGKALFPEAPPVQRLSSRAEVRRRREALRCLSAGLVRIERDPQLPPLALFDIRQVIRTLPTKAELGSRMVTMRLERFNEAMSAIQRSCQLLEAVADGIFPAGERQQARARRLLTSLPPSEELPLAELGPEERLIWSDWLLGKIDLSRSDASKQDADAPCSPMSN
ncbi:hypothetical protein HNQ51_003717 [Inhella inkyongensis]|uniref:Uncharacterized protein n=1 Tax=Inhella inkyongensis TaxID=392593 RepID=A0A840SD65_9BURK|nr:hypothetical protein [Inhella inkyongensis]MBB5206371.1 hypothetical protein [Inhella inkyongensis]